MFITFPVPDFRKDPTDCMQGSVQEEREQKGGDLQVYLAKGLNRTISEQKDIQVEGCGGSVVVKYISSPRGLK